MAAYVRYVIPTTILDTNAREGFFCAAYTLRRDDTLDQYSQDFLEELLGWFRTNLTIPDKFSRSSSKGAYRRNTFGLSWFKITAKYNMGKSQELIGLLGMHGYSVDTLRTDRVGYIVYEDDVQIVAEPFHDTPR